jgi:hypothetical protein
MAPMSTLDTTTEASAKTRPASAEDLPDYARSADDLRPMLTIAITSDWYSKWSRQESIRQ